MTKKFMINWTHSFCTLYMQKSFVNEAIIDLLADNRISEDDDGDQMHNINPLSVAVQPSEKKKVNL